MTNIKHRIGDATPEFSVGQKVRIDFFMDQHEHDGEVGTIQKVELNNDDGILIWIYHLEESKSDPVHGNTFLETELEPIDQEGE